MKRPRIGIASSLAIYDNLADKLCIDSKVTHYGAHKIKKTTKLYKPVSKILPVPEKFVIELANFFNEKSDFLLVSNLNLPSNEDFHKNLKIPYFFPSREHVINLEYNKYNSKQLLHKLGIPTLEGYKSNGLELFKNFYKIKRPFVIKFFPYMKGRQTTIVNDENYEEVFLDFYSNRLQGLARFTNVNDDFTCVIEDYIKIKSEESYHVIMNDSNWQFFGSARDYKKIHEGDKGHNYISSGAYSLNKPNFKINEYADKIFQHFKSIGKPYKGFLFIGIAHMENGDPIVLELNTRSGDPELVPMISSLENNLSEIFYKASTGINIPEIKHKNLETVSIRLLNKNKTNWDREPNFPMFSNVPDDIMINLEGTHIFQQHSLLSCSGSTVNDANQRIYDFLKTQHLGDFNYRKDIGIYK